jgi:hypothetical protein
MQNPKPPKPPTLTPAQIAEANQRHDSQFSKSEVKAYRKIKNKFYDKADLDEVNRASLGTGWNNRWQDSWSAKSNNAQDSILRNQINIKKNKNK